MKKIILTFAALSIMAASIVSCNSGSNAEKAREDSIRTADSLAALEAEREAEEALKAAEAARLDSMRLDSLAKIPAIYPSDFLKKEEGMMTFKNNIGKIIETQGFNLTDKKTVKVKLGSDGTTTGKAEKCTYEKNGTIITLVTVKEAGYGDDPELEISFPNKDASTAFMDAAKKLGYKKAFGNTYMPEDMGILAMIPKDLKVTFRYEP